LQRKVGRLALWSRDVSASSPWRRRRGASASRFWSPGATWTRGVDCDAAAATAIAAFGQVDILVNVAGGSGPIGKTGVETTEEEFDEIIHLNMRGPSTRCARCCRA
jgi:3-oxoacyl-[acyl-carrier protein] reductase